MMSEKDGLGALKMGITRDDNRGVARGEGDETPLELFNFDDEGGNLIAQPESDVESDLVIAGTASMKLSTRRDPPGKLRLDVHMDVFEFGFPLEPAGGNFASNEFKAAKDGRAFPPRQDSNFCQHASLCAGAEDIVPPQSPVERDGFGKCSDLRRRAGGKASGTRDGGARGTGFPSHVWRKVMSGNWKTGNGIARAGHAE